MNDSVSSSGAQVLAAAISSGTMAFLGLPSLALTWAFIGAVGALVFTPPESRGMAVLRIGISGLIGAGLGFACAKWVGGGDAGIIAACLMFGAVAKQIMSTALPALLESGLERAKAWISQMGPK